MLFLQGHIAVTVSEVGLPAEVSQQAEADGNQREASLL